MRMEENYFTFVLPLYVFCSLAECTVSQGNTKPLSANVYAKKKKNIVKRCQVNKVHL